MANFRGMLVKVFVLLGLEYGLFSYAVIGYTADHSAREIAHRVFYSIEEAPYGPGVLEKAATQLRLAASLDGDEAWVHIALSRLYLQAGFLSGDRFNLASYAADFIERAHIHAKRAVELAPSMSMSVSQLARIQIILKDRDNAWKGLSVAYKADPADFYPWFLRAVMERADSVRANKSLEEAERRATKLYQHRLVNLERIDLASGVKDVESAEKYHKKAIELEPGSAHAYGNYGHFLFWHKRYEEAVVQLEKAVAIFPYPLAVEELKRAKLLRDIHGR